MGRLADLTKRPEPRVSKREAQRITKRIDALVAQLRAAGYNEGPIMGVYGPRDLAAIRKHEGLR